MRPDLGTSPINTAAIRSKKQVNVSDGNETSWAVGKFVFEPKSKSNNFGRTMPRDENVTPYFDSLIDHNFSACMVKTAF